MLQNLTEQQYEQEKIRIITLMFNPYNSDNSDEYVAGQQVAEDKIQNRIDYQMFMNKINHNTKIQEDVYQLTFEQLLKINKKNTKKFVDEYYKNPNNVYWLAYTILKLKGFAINPKNPDYANHSLAKSIQYASSFKKDNTIVSLTEDDDESYSNNELILFEEADKIEGFENKYGFNVEQILNKLTDDEKEMFLSLSKSRKGFLSRVMKEKVQQLYNKIKEIKNNMTEKGIYSKLLSMEDRLLFFNKYGEVTLLQEDLEILRELYKVYFPQFSKLNTSCSSCIKDMLNTCISRYSHLKKVFEPDVTDEDIKPVGSITITQADDDMVADITNAFPVDPVVDEVKPIKKVTKLKKK